MPTPLKLRAVSPDDLDVVSALLQDAAVKVSDMAWDQGSRCFALVVNRFVHEKRRWFRKPKGERIRTGFHVRGVEHVRMRGIDLADSAAVLSLLAIRHDVDEGVAVTLTLEFSGDASVQIEAECIDGVLADMGDAWDALARPHHGKA